MTMTRPVALARISRQLKDAEKKADAALLATSELMSTLLVARDDPELTAHTGQDALTRLVHAQVSILEGSTGIFRAHNAVAKIGVELGILEESVPTDPLGQIAVEPNIAAA